MNSVDELRCCPYAETGEGFMLPVVSLRLEIQVNVIVATIKLTVIYRNISGRTVSGVYKASNAYGRATVTSCDVTHPGCHFVTAVIDPSVVSIDTGAKNPDWGNNSNHQYQDLLYFTMPFRDLPPNSDMTVELNYIQQLSFTSLGFYELIVPTYVPKDRLVSASVMTHDIFCKLDVGTVTCAWQVPTHSMEVIAQDGPFCALQSTNRQSNNYFHLTLNALSNQISCSFMIQQNHSSMQQPGGSFMAFVSAPETQFLPPCRVGRKMVFTYFKLFNID